MMKSWKRERKSFCPVFERLHPQFAEQTPEFQGNGSNTNDSDTELDNLESPLNPAKMISESENDTLYIREKENLPMNANLSVDIDSKENEVEKTKQIALDLQDRFVWDLCLAIKQNLCQQNKKDKKMEEAIAKLGVRDLVEKFQNDPVDPVEWKDWIMEQYQTVGKI